ncbi:hypothetical protein [Cystobacter ferrugineus]|uniref:Protein kinase n=1 Tax=Cystobacter ferrugineus TaxID=83449 RepID=A0A1L9BK08_9BACT|nr:hypothetical protein [Cystobacter ferrugineus]OJH42536.1 hypothetical protein BON30_04915 [Cystobacter ferrugineus]
MGDSHDRTGGRLGPYLLHTRYQELDEPGGQVYAAHHVDTGCPALVLVPKPEDTWAPRSDWTARVTSQVSPPFLATELERPPPADADALSDVGLGFIRLAGAMAAVEDREEANTAFTQMPTPQPSERHTTRVPGCRHVRTGALVAGVLVLVAVVLCPHGLGSPVRGADTTEPMPAEPTFWADQADVDSAIGYPMPKEPFPGQMKPPCGEGAYVEIRGACWYQGKQDAPCPKGTAEYEGKCYMPVRAKKPEPRSLEP